MKKSRHISTGVRRQLRSTNTQRHKLVLYVRRKESFCLKNGAPVRESVQRTFDLSPTMPLVLFPVFLTMGKIRHDPRWRSSARSGL